jgi:hypothetical protein
MSPLSTDRITLESWVKVTGTQVFSQMKGEGVILDFHSGIYYGLDEISFQIWSLLQQPIQVKAIIKQLSDEYEVSLDQCQQEVLQLLQGLLTEKLIQIQDR